MKIVTQNSTTGQQNVLAMFDTSFIEQLHPSGTTPDGMFGYTMIDDYLVPTSFLRQLQELMTRIKLEPTTVYGINDLCREFGRELTFEELQVVGHCFLLVLTYGQEPAFPDPNLDPNFIEPGSTLVH